MTSVLRNMSNAISMMTTNFRQIQNAMNAPFNTTMFQGATRAMQQAMSQMALIERQARQTKTALNWDRLPAFNVIQGSGIERMNREVAQIQGMINNVINAEQRLKNQFNSTSTRSILPPNAINDIAHAQNRVEALINSIRNIANQDLSGLSNSQANYFNSSFEAMRRNIDAIKGAMSSMNQNMQSGNISALNADTERFLSLMQQGQAQVRNLSEALNQINGFKWQSSTNPEIFTSTGLTRARQEILSAQQMSQRLIQTQQVITQQSLRMRLINPTAANDINRLNSRIANISSTIQRLQREQQRLSRWDTNGINQYNSRIESLRNIMSRIIQTQDSWNEAVRNNDIERVNQLYQQLVNLTDTIDNNTRDNTTQQHMFNNALNMGVGNANVLSNALGSVGNRIKSYASMYLSIRGLKQGIGISDTYTNMNSRLKLINDGLQTHQELQTKIYSSALKSRGVYNDTVNIIAKLGLLAQNAFTSNDELIYFSELMQKSFKLSGSGVQERQAGMYQLTQAMASGRLQGDEFRSIMENAPMLANAIANYTGKNISGLRMMSREGTITADIIKNALFTAADEIEQRYRTMPMTFGDIWNQIGSTATMSFSPLFEQINGFANSDFMNTIMTGLPEAFNKISMDLGIIGTHVGGFLEDISPYIDEIASGFSKVGRYIISANGLMGTFSNTLTGLITSSGGRQFFNVLSIGAMDFAKSINWVIENIGKLNNQFNNFLPNLGGAIVGFTTFKTVNSTVSPIINTVGNYIRSTGNATLGLAAATNSAALAQQGLNTVMAANKFLFVANGIATVISALWGVVEGIKAVNEAANAAAHNANIGGYDDKVWQYSEKYGFDLPYAQRIVETRKNTEDRINANLKLIEENTKYRDKYFSEAVKWHETIAEFESKGAKPDPVVIRDYNKYIAKCNAIAQAEEENKALWARQSKTLDSIVKESDKARQLEKKLKDLGNTIGQGSTNIPLPFDGGGIGGIGNIGSVGNVGSVDKINDTVDISSEDLRYLRELAEREVINQYTNTVLVPKFEVNFGDIYENADVHKVIEELKQQLYDEISSSSNGVHL